ncbi:AraC family transcriptional regulator [Paenibacillus sambharensis]|uniref:AraC family transcriptional regulator n=1 Tax=Paenibacillus sambharensis TaxID=1803190 RepID=A0A2W1LBQ5_9BACL|nr:AraC family transcriptional regulator [Paenibacillus sambharensis]PZD97648.1 AraC family transcriptional regulator [Paenibacillus sambharensis]
MPVIRFHALPMPYYICSGHCLTAPGRGHPDRYALGEFDLLVVDQGCLYIGEEDRRYELAEGHALILRPDSHHYPAQGCREITGSYYLHFQTAGVWDVLSDAEGASRLEEPQAGEDGGAADHHPRVAAFDIRIPQFTRLLNAGKMYELLRQLNELERDSHLGAVKWKQQMLFQEVLMQLEASMADKIPRPGADIADQAASYLRLHYRERISIRSVGEALNFHPVYIARCMQKQFGCSPMEYLMRYRLEQAKKLLLQTDLPVSQIGQDVGFQQAAYFTSCFGRWEGITPREYRQRFMLGHSRNGLNG